MKNVITYEYDGVEVIDYRPQGVMVIEVLYSFITRFCRLEWSNTARQFYIQTQAREIFTEQDEKDYLNEFQHALAIKRHFTNVLLK